MDLNWSSGEESEEVEEDLAEKIVSKFSKMMMKWMDIKRDNSEEDIQNKMMDFFKKMMDEKHQHSSEEEVSVDAKKMNRILIFIQKLMEKKEKHEDDNEIDSLIDLIKQISTAKHQSSSEEIKSDKNNSEEEEKLRNEFDIIKIFLFKKMGMRF